MLKMELLLKYNVAFYIKKFRFLHLSDVFEKFFKNIRYIFKYFRKIISKKIKELLINFFFL
jgi:hypothetical protein